MDIVTTRPTRPRGAELVKMMTVRLIIFPQYTLEIDNIEIQPAAFESR